MKSLTDAFRSLRLAGQDARSVPAGRLRVAWDPSDISVGGLIQQIEETANAGQFKKMSWQHRNDCDVLIMELDPEDSRAMSKFHLLRKQAENASILILCGSNDGRRVGALFQAGADDVLCAPHQAEDIVKSLARISAQKKKQRWSMNPNEPGRIIGILKAGGGVGATSLALNTANLVCDGTLNVCVVDLDLQGGACALQLDLATGIDVVDMIEASSGGVDVSLKESAVIHASGLHLLPSPAQILGHADPNELDIPFFAANLRREFAASFVDFPQVLSPWDQAMLRECDQFVIVTRLAVPNIRLASRLLATIEGLGLGERAQCLVLNAHKKAAIPLISISDGERALGRKFDIRIPRKDEAFSSAINEGVLLDRRSDCADVLMEFEALADLLLSSLRRDEMVR